MAARLFLSMIARRMCDRPDDELHKIMRDDVVGSASSISTLCEPGFNPTRINVPPLASTKHHAKAQQRPSHAAT
jgi:hypothetical protein